MSTGYGQPEKESLDGSHGRFFHELQTMRLPRRGLPAFPTPPIFFSLRREGHALVCAMHTGETGHAAPDELPQIETFLKMHGCTHRCWTPRARRRGQLEYAFPGTEQLQAVFAIHNGSTA